MMPSAAPNRPLIRSKEFQKNCRFIAELFLGPAVVGLCLLLALWADNSAVKLVMANRLSPDAWGAAGRLETWVSIIVSIGAVAALFTSILAFRKDCGPTGEGLIGRRHSKRLFVLTGPVYLSFCLLLAALCAWNGLHACLDDRWLLAADYLFFCAVCVQCVWSSSHRMFR